MNYKKQWRLRVDIFIEGKTDPERDRKRPRKWVTNEPASQWKCYRAKL